jgi:RNA polymerase sigma-70 factor (ECF subfamily)
MHWDGSNAQGAQRSDDELLAVLRAPGPEGRSSDDDAQARRSALETLFARYHRKVYHWCNKLLGDADLAADMVQEVFLELLERPRPYVARQRFGAWLYVATRNRCLNALRRRGREQGGDERVELALSAVVDGSDPHREAEQAELARRLDDACRRLLSPREQEVFHLRYVLGLRVAEITAVLGLSNASGARTHLRSAEQKLRRALEDLRTGPRPGQQEE